MAVSHWDSFQEEAENPLLPRSVPAPTAGTRATPRPLPSSGSPAVPFHAAGGAAPAPPILPDPRIWPRKGWLLGTDMQLGMGRREVGSRALARPACLFGYLVWGPGLILERSELRPREVECLVQSLTASE